VKIRGYRIEPGEVEAALRAQAGVQAAAVVARAGPGGAPQLVGYIAGEADTAELRRNLRAQLPEYLVPGWLVKLERLPLTGNGKLDRRALPEPEWSQSARHYVAPRTPIEQMLAEIWAEVLGLERVGIEDNFFELGGDSILSIQVNARAHQRGLGIKPRQLFERQTIAGLAEVAEWAERRGAGPEERAGEAPLTPIQQWFFEQPLEHHEHFNQALVLGVRGPSRPELWEQLVQGLVARHDALRLRFRAGEQGWGQESVPAPRQRVFGGVDLSQLSAQQAAWEGLCVQVQTSLDYQHGPLLRVLWVDRGAGGERLLLVIHHLAVDAVSWRILLEELETGYAQLEKGGPLDWGAAGSSFRAWAEQLQQYAANPALSQQWDWWQQALQGGDLPQDFSGPNTQASAAQLSRALEEEETQALLQQAGEAYHTRTEELLATALAAALGEWSRQQPVRMDWERHGREDIGGDLDVARTVGWFTTLHPLTLRLPPAGGEGERLKAVKEQLRAVPQKGLGYGLLRYAGTERQREMLRAAGNAPLLFNYLGQFDVVLAPEGRLTPAQESAGESSSRTGLRSHVLVLTAHVSAKRLQLHWQYSTNLHSPRTIERFADRFLAELRALIRHCCSDHAGGYTPSDFPAITIDQKALDELLQKLNSSVTRRHAELRH
jgi:non-ribosomal peptide synthase protein (TIGR01720 family)